ncbi:hypothetical protein [Moheibacter sp.]|uniref:hypothetical protein n=1 Tax=Moheibacter sp. TaxID=1965316 RepID=UPI003C77B0F8
MKKTLLFCSVFMAGYFTNAQDIVAATGLTKGKIEFNDFRKIDVNNLNASSILLTKADKVNFESLTADVTKTCSCGKYIAAMTVAQNGDLFYLPMNGNKVSMINTSSKTGTLIDVPNTLVNNKNQGTYFARMTTGSDGFIYALNNDGSELLKISSSGSIQNLGSVSGIAEFAKASGVETSVYGGDMIADAFGNLYVISASANVFKFNPNKLNAEYIGKINGLANGYTVNGAAVMKDGNVLLATTSAHGLYVLDMNTLEATFKSDYSVPVYDLASPYFLRQSTLDEFANAQSKYSLYPTIVKNSELNIVSKSTENSTLHVTVWNLNNKQIYSKNLTVNSIGDYKVNLSGSLQPGIYVLKATNQEGVEVINTKFTLVR